MTRNELGWNPVFEYHFENHAAQGRFPCRVFSALRGRYRITGEKGTYNAAVSGRFRHETQSASDFPVTGDWVAASTAGPETETAVIHAVLPRATSFSRKAGGGETAEQVVAANIDTVFLVSGLDHDYNPRRVERYLTQAWESGAQPVIVLNKADCREDTDACLAEIEAIAFGVPVHAVSALCHSGLETLTPYLASGKTVAFLGSSGAGKSTLVNSLTGELRQRTAAVRADDSRGRHTTTRRELIPMPGGALLMDTPGLRELQLWTSEDGLAGAFSDIAALSKSCRFRDCSHESEPGCSVRSALKSGELPAARLESWRKQQRELRYLASRQDHRIRKEETDRWKQIKKDYRRHFKKE
jgi:ribosome biogenesis GTPase / thiamine phosphate phosphatase